MGAGIGDAKSEADPVATGEPFPGRFSKRTLLPSICFECRARAVPARPSPTSGTHTQIRDVPKVRRGNGASLQHFAGNTRDKRLQDRLRLRRGRHGMLHSPELVIP